MKRKYIYIYIYIVKFAFVQLIKVFSRDLEIYIDIEILFGLQVITQRQSHLIKKEMKNIYFFLYF